MRHLRLSAVYFVALALLLRALVPVGWMPNTGLEQHSALMPCPMMGGMVNAPQTQHPAKHNPVSSHDGSFCRYGTTAHYTPPPQVPVLQSLLANEAGGPSDSASGLVFVSSLVWDHAARAPPPGV